MAVLDVDLWSVAHWIVYVARCERCGTTGGNVALHDAATAYSDERLNRAVMLCSACAEEYYEYWGEMWKEYERTRG